MTRGSAESQMTYFPRSLCLRSMSAICSSNIPSPPSAPNMYRRRFLRSYAHMESAVGSFVKPKSIPKRNTLNCARSSGVILRTVTLRNTSPPVPVCSPR